MHQTGSKVATPVRVDSAELLRHVLPMVLATSCIVGTGGTARMELWDLKSPTGAGIVFRFPSACGRRQAQEQILLPQEQLAGIRRYLSLNISDLAKVLRVERPTIYSWLKGESNPRSGHNNRIALVYSIAHEWRTISSEPIRGMLNMRYQEQASLLELLSAETINASATHRALAILRQALDRVPSRKTVAEIAKERGIRLPVRKLSADDLQSET